MTTTQYIGARYVPIFADPSEWNNTRTYEPLTIVMHDGNSYTSRQYVPKGIDISNDDFWALTGNYNAQVEAYRKDVLRLEDEVDAEQARATAAETKLTEDLASEVERATAAEGVLQTNINAEVERATAAESVLQTNINAEVERATAAENKINTTFTLVKTLYDYGAVGDGVTDDTASILDALNNEETVYITPGVYRIATVLNPNGKCNLIGLGGVFKIDSRDSSEYAFNFSNDTVIDNVTFTSTVDKTTNGINGSLKDAPTSNVGVMAVRNADYVKVTNCTFINTYLTIFVNGVTRNTDVVIENCMFENAYSGIFSNNADVYMKDCRIEFSDYANTYYHLAYPSQESNLDHLILDGCSASIANPQTPHSNPTIFSLNSTASISQTVKEVTVRNCNLKNVRLFYLTASAVTINNLIVDGNVCVYDCVPGTYTNVINYTDGTYAVTNCVFKNLNISASAIHLTAPSTQNVLIKNCNLVNFRIADQSGGASNENCIIKLTNCSIESGRGLGFIRCNLEFLNCTIITNATSSAYVMFIPDANTPLLKLSNCAIKGGGSSCYIFSKNSTADNTIVLGTVFNDVQNTFLGEQKLVNCIRNNVAI